MSHHHHHHHDQPDEAVVDRSRFIAHDLADPPTLPAIVLLDPKETATLAQRLREGWDEVLARVPPDAAESGRDYTVYTGLGGIAYVALQTAVLLLHRQQQHLSPSPHRAALVTPLQRLHSEEEAADVRWVRGQSPADYLDRASRYLAAAEAALERSERRGHRRDVSFMMGSPGVHAQRALLHRLQGDKAAAQAAVGKVLAVADEVTAPNSAYPSEVLYGAAGYLTALTFLRAHGFSAVEVPDAVVAAVARHVVERGEEGPGGSLRYWWHDTNYVGAAHGASGIMLALLDAQALVPSALSPSHMGRVQATVEYIRTLRLSSGNYPSRPDQPPSRDRLVQFCHGAPGPLLLFVRAYETWGDPRYLAWAEDAADVVWSRGLLRKGNGLCHGVSGNAYCFLSCYRGTNGSNDRFLHRAREFALAAEEPQTTAQQGTPDHPWSLFEGRAGLLALYTDLVLNPHPAMARFPAFEMGNWGPVVAGAAVGGGGGKRGVAEEEEEEG